MKANIQRLTLNRFTYKAVLESFRNKGFIIPDIPEEGFDFGVDFFIDKDNKKVTWREVEGVIALSNESRNRKIAIRDFNGKYSDKGVHLMEFGNSVEVNITMKVQYSEDLEVSILKDLARILL